VGGKEINTYQVKLLENEIRYGSGGVKRLYPFRFGEKNESL